jgi:DNA end-binding protein Ku
MRRQGYQKPNVAQIRKGKKPRKAAAGQKEMLLPIEGKKPAAKKAAKPERATGRRKAG